MSKRMKLLIGYDGSDCGEAAIDDLGRVGLPPDAEARILSVAEIWLPPPPPSSFEIVEQTRQLKVPADIKRVYSRESTMLSQAQALADRAAARLKAKFPNWRVTPIASSGSAAWELVFNSDQWNPDLIVVGSHGRSALGRFVLGSVSQRVLTEARCSVRVARGRVEEPDTPVRIIVGVDGSPGSQAAIDEIAARVWPLKTEVKVLAVNDPLTPTLIGQLIPPVARTIRESNEADREWLTRILNAYAGCLRRAEVIVSTQIRDGDPKRELVAAAETWGADSIFVGSIGFSNRLERFVLGSVSAAVVARAQCSVEVVRKRKTA